MRPGLTRLGLAMALLWGAACAGPGYDYADLPDSPVAIVFRTMAESDQVYDEVIKQERDLVIRRTGRIPATTKREQAKLDAEVLAGLLGIVGDAAERRGAKLGRLSLVNPRTAEITNPEWSHRGALPLGWSPDRTRLLFISSNGGSRQIFERNFVTSQSRQVSSGRLRYLDAKYCGESGIIMAAIDRGGRSRLFLRVDGEGPPRQVTSGPIAYAPSCTPDGHTVLYEKLEGRGVAVIERLDLRDPDAEPKRLTRGSRPVISPDGSTVAYVVGNRRTSKIWRMRPDGSGRHPLGKSGKWERSPTFSPDGKYIVFTATEGESEVRPQLWVRPLNGDADRPLRVQGDALLPAW